MNYDSMKHLCIKIKIQTEGNKKKIGSPDCFVENDIQNIMPEEMKKKVVFVVFFKTIYNFVSHIFKSGIKRHFFKRKIYKKYPSS